MSTNGAAHKREQTPEQDEGLELIRRAKGAARALALVAAMVVAGGAAAETGDQAAESGAQTADQTGDRAGPVTSLPLPRFVSLKSGEGNARRGPSLSHRIDWVFKRRGMPLEITGEYGHWRRVRDREGAGGWMHYALLSGVRTVIVTRDGTELLRRPDANSQVIAQAEAEVVAELDECAEGWCRISADGNAGWVSQEDLWGVYPDEDVE